jgi:adenine-specific DNA glycosylase
MNKIDVYDIIIKSEGDCFTEKDPPCRFCPLQEKCMFKMIADAKYISKETRLQWALDELAKEFLIDGTP